MSGVRQLAKVPMDLSDAIAINALMSALGTVQMGDDGAEAALHLLHRAFGALKAGAMPTDLQLTHCGPEIRVVREINAHNVCSCGREAIEDVGRCESCGHDLVFSIAVPAIPECGRLRCAECGSHEFLLYLGDGVACAMLRNTVEQLSFQREAMVGSDPPFYLDAGFPGRDRPSLRCGGACTRAIVVPLGTSVVYGEGVPFVTKPAAAPARVPASDLPAFEDRGTPPEYPFIAQARVAGRPFAFLTVGPYESDARLRAERTLRALRSDVRDLRVRPGDCPLGERVELLHDVDRYSFVAPAGATGVVTACSKHLCAVTLDEPIPGTEAWDGEVHFTIEDAVAHQLEPRSAVMALWEACEPRPRP